MNGLRPVLPTSHPPTQVRFKLCDWSSRIIFDHSRPPNAVMSSIIGCTWSSRFGFEQQSGPQNGSWHNFWLRLELSLKTMAPKYPSQPPPNNQRSTGWGRGWCRVGHRGRGPPFMNHSSYNAFHFHAEVPWIFVLHILFGHDLSHPLPSHPHPQSRLRKVQTIQLHHSMAWKYLTSSPHP